MKRVFVDSLYIVALINPNDQWREKALQAKRETADAKLVTTEIVLIEVLNFLSEYGANLRRQVSLFVRDILGHVTEKMFDERKNKLKFQMCNLNQ
jgi:predicted nucleic acid-binding protein